MGHFFGPTPNPIPGEGFFQGSKLVYANKWNQLITGFENDANTFSFVAYLNEHWVISGYGPTELAHVVFVSANGGATWLKNAVATTAAASPSTGTAFGNSNYVYVVRGATGVQPFSFTSPDLSTWSQNNTGFANAALTSTPVFGPGVFLLVRIGAADYATSPDGITWTHHNAYVPQSWLASPIWDGTRFVALVISSGSSSNKIAVSTDGINWTESSATLSNLSIPNAIANQGATQYVAGDAGGGAGDSVNGALTVATAISFSDSTHPTQALCFGDTHWTRCNELTNALQSSTDGMTWSQDTVPSAGGGYSSIGFDGASKFIAVGFGNITNNFAATRNG